MGTWGDSVQHTASGEVSIGFPLHAEMGRHCLGVGGRFCLRRRRDSAETRLTGAMTAPYQLRLPFSPLMPLR